MRNKLKEAELYVVVQFGGSSGEQYLHTFTNERAAHRYIHRAKKASYRCLEPFPIDLPSVPKLSGAVKELIKWLKRNQIADAEPVTRLRAAYAEMQRELGLN